MGGVRVREGTGEGVERPRDVADERRATARRDAIEGSGEVTGAIERPHERTRDLSCRR
jgi:hypothetical protein